MSEGKTITVRIDKAVADRLDAIVRAAKADPRTAMLTRTDLIRSALWAAVIHAEEGLATLPILTPEGWTAQEILGGLG